MLSFLKKHPFAVEAFFESSLVLTYALPVAALRPMIPAKLEPDVFQHKWAFIAIAIVSTQDLRPKGFPVFMGNDFVLAGYRAFVRYTNSQGKTLRGLYILKSETNKKKMEVLGNLFTHYKYSTTDIVINKEEDRISVNSRQSGINIAVYTGKEDAHLPPDSPFDNWKEARRFAGPLPFTFNCDNKSPEVLIIEGVRENWIPQPVEVIASQVDFFKMPAWKDAILANAFLIQNIPYHWKKGKVDIWKG